MKYYGSPLCPDCVEATRLLAERGVQYEWIDITASMPNLKAFLALRDTREEFAQVRAEGRVGIPCFVAEDGKISFDVQS
ncbi:MAG: glutaredoxin [Clostridia bacterium]|nr:glutaredoxin [Clostridia bacterium]